MTSAVSKNNPKTNNTSVRIVRAIVSEKVVPHLVSLLQLNQPELQLPVVKILRAVAEESESGLIEACPFLVI